MSTLQYQNLTLMKDDIINMLINFYLPFQENIIKQDAEFKSKYITTLENLQFQNQVLKNEIQEELNKRGTIQTQLLPTIQQLQTQNVTLNRRLNLVDAERSSLNKKYMDELKEQQVILQHNLEIFESSNEDLLNQERVLNDEVKKLDEEIGELAAQRAKRREAKKRETKAKTEVKVPDQKTQPNEYFMWLTDRFIEDLKKLNLSRSQKARLLLAFTRFKEPITGCSTIDQAETLVNSLNKIKDLNIDLPKSFLNQVEWIKTTKLDKEACDHFNTELTKFR